MSVLVDLSIFPMDQGPEVSRAVSRAVAVIRGSGLPHTLGAMGTCIEGEWDEVMGVVSQCFAELADQSERVYMTMKVDYRKGRQGGLTGKIASVEQRLAGDGA